jgi:hemolysin activation/secretion protein
VSPHRNRLFCALFCAVLLPSTPVLAQVPAPDPDAAPVPPPRFDIRRFTVEGNTLLPKAEVDALLAPHSGTSRDFGDVQRALESLQDRYTERGYTAVRVLVPEQDIRAGTVTLQVIEAVIGKVKVEGNKFFDEGNVRRALPGLKEGTPPNARQLSQQMQLANENPAKQGSLSLEASDEEAKVDATVRIADERPWRVSTFVDNTGNSQTGQYRAGAGYQHANMFNRDHVFNLQYVTSPEKISDVTVLGLGYRIPMYGWNGTVEAFAGHSDVNSGTIQNLFNVSGAGTIFGLRYTQVLPRLDTYEHKLAVGWDYRAFKSDVTLLGTTGTLVPDITITPLSVAYSGRLPGTGRDLSFYASYSHNLPGGSDGDQAAFNAQRFGASANYSIVRYGAAYTQALPEDLLLRAAYSAQYTRDLLVSGEQFGMGGMDSVRGFFERETANDLGHRASLELYTRDFGAKIGEGWRGRALTFIDAARGYDRMPARVPENGLSSLGVGLRLNQGKALSVRADWAWVVNGAGSRPEGSNKLHFSVAYTFQ